MFFIPRYGIAGAALSTAVSSFIYNLLKYFFIWYKFKMQPFDKNSAYVLGVMILCFLTNMAIPDTQQPIFNMMIHSCVIFPIYLAAVYFLKIVPEFHSYIPLIGKKRSDNKRT